MVSVDTYKAATARAATAAGAEIINDVSGFTWDPEMANACADIKAGVVLTHTRGRPEEWRTQPQLAPEAVLNLVRDGLAWSLAAAMALGLRAGIDRRRSRLWFRQTLRRELRPAGAAGSIAVAGSPAARRNLAQIVPWTYPGSALRGIASTHRGPRNGERGGHGGGHTAWRFHRARSHRQARSRGGAHCRCRAGGRLARWSFPPHRVPNAIGCGQGNRFDQAGIFPFSALSSRAVFALSGGLLDAIP